MTIDEAIAHAREKADKNSGCWKYCTDIKDCETCEKENEQLAEWFEELKMYRENERTLDNAYNNVYNKAIDDFSNEIDKYIERYDGTIYDEAYYPNIKSDFEDLKKICNQLKEGV